MDIEDIKSFIEDDERKIMKLNQEIEDLLYSYLRGKTLFGGDQIDFMVCEKNKEIQELIKEIYDLRGLLYKDREKAEKDILKNAKTSTVIRKR